MKKKYPIILFIILLVLLLIFNLIWVRALSPREIDDISPEIFCEEGYIAKADILWIIPKYNNKPISENKGWCQYILSLNKTLGMHGVYHNYNEFLTDRSQEYLQEGIDVFEECFGEKPKLFKPPQLKISEENKKLIKDNNMKLKTKFNQGVHKVYHCEDTGKLPNKIIDLI